eukprot:15327018-Ditylum_brightwellii.AAC.1
MTFLGWDTRPPPSILQSKDQTVMNVLPPSLSSKQDNTFETTSPQQMAPPPPPSYAPPHAAMPFA